MSAIDDTSPPSRKKISSRTPASRTPASRTLVSRAKKPQTKDSQTKDSQTKALNASSDGASNSLSSEKSNPPNPSAKKALSSSKTSPSSSDNAFEDLPIEALVKTSSVASAKDVIQKVKSSAKRLGKKTASPRPSIAKKTLVSGVASEDMEDKQVPIDALSASDDKTSPPHLPVAESIKTHLPVVQSKDAHRALVLMEKIKQYHQEYNKVLPMEKIPPHVRRLQQDLHQYLGQCYEAVDSMDQLVEKIYRSTVLNVEQKSLFRETVVKVFGKNIFFHPTAPAVIIDVFALPVFGDVASVRQLFAEKQTMANMGDLVVSGGYVDPRSKLIALLNVPLKSSAISRPEVLHTLSAVWGEYVFQKDKVDEKTGQEIIRSVLEDLKPHEAESGHSGFVIPGIRVWVSGGPEYINNNEILSRWSVMNEEEKVLPQFWWQLSVGRMIMKAGVKPGSLMIRPPVLPLVAQAQSLAWHLIQQVYERLGTAPFDEINFVSVAENKLALRAYDHRKRLIAQSDVVSLFDVTASPDDFSELMKYECDTRGPRSQLREIVRSLSAYRLPRE